MPPAPGATPDPAIGVVPAAALDIVAPPASPAAPPDLTSIPHGLGLPVAVRVGVAIVDLRAVDDRNSSFTATVDLRARWTDPRLRDPDAITGTFASFRDVDVDARLANLWAPDLGLRNQLGEPSGRRRALRVYASGEIELLTRVTATFSTTFDLSSFPFDHQRLPLEVVSRRDPSALVALSVRADDLEYSQASERVRLDSWAPIRVTVARNTEVGWYGESQDGLTVTLEVERRPGPGVLAIFIPLLAVLMIPILALWLNRVEHGEFKVGAVDLTNILLGGLFAVIALNFTIGSAYPALMASDNTIARLLGLIYVTLGTNLVINITLFRFGLARRWFGRDVQEHLYRFLVWGLPVLTIATAVAIVLAAMA